MTATAPAEMTAEIVRAPDEYRGLTLVVSPIEGLKRFQELQAFVSEVMIEGIDYGKIPGVDKPTLFQPGAQKLAEVYGFAHCFENTTTVEDWEKPFFMFRRRCVLTLRRNGLYIGDGVGSCNSKEDRYAWRWMWANKVPKGIEVATLKSRIAGSKGDTQYRFPNEDIFSLVNTIEKMACKRSYIHAVTSVTRSSGLFSQDIEDLPPDAYGSADDSRSWEKGDKGGDEEPKRERGVDKVDGFLAALASAKDDNDCKAVGRDMMTAHKAGQISDKQRDAMHAAIKARRESLAAQANGGTPPPANGNGSGETKGA